ncbi:hypothetical protein OG571_42015 [Streptomyces sp. NBC_01369]
METPPIEQPVDRAHTRLASGRRGSQGHHTHGTHLGDHTRGIETALLTDD